MKTNKLLKISFAVISAAILLSTNAKASLVISDNSTGVHISGSSNPSSSDIASALGISTSNLGSLLYKINSDGSEDGSLQTSYSGSPTSSGGFTSFPIIITYNGGSFASAPTYLLVKDGNLGSYVFDISGWNGTDEIDIGNMFPSKGVSGTSHVEFFGTSATPVPEASTIAAGALLILPFATQTIRYIRNRKQTA